MHCDAGGYDLKNKFFVDLATPQKWVTSTVLHSVFVFFLYDVNLVLELNVFDMIFVNII